MAARLAQYTNRCLPRLYMLCSVMQVSTAVQETQQSVLQTMTHSCSNSTVSRCRCSRDVYQRLNQETNTRGRHNIDNIMLQVSAPVSPVQPGIDKACSLMCLQQTNIIPLYKSRDPRDPTNLGCDTTRTTHPQAALCTQCSVDSARNWQTSSGDRTCHGHTALHVARALSVAGDTLDCTSILD